MKRITTDIAKRKKRKTQSIPKMKREDNKKEVRSKEDKLTKKG